MRRDKDYKLVWYTDDTYGEVFDVCNDPYEQHNLWENPQYLDTRDNLLQALKEWLALSMLRTNMKPSEKAQQAMTIE